MICCGRGMGKNADILHDIVFDLSQVSEWKEPITKRRYNYFIANIDNKQVPVVSFYHPQVRGDHNKFMKLYEEMIEIGNILKENYHHSHF